jgi:hypothetical protein
MSVSGVNWGNIGDLSVAGINWFEIDNMSRRNLNWDDLGELTTSGINWYSLGDMTSAGINWNDIDVLTKSSINWADIVAMSTSSINWADISYMSGTSINWGDMTVSSTSGVNWNDLANMSHQNIDWSEMSYFSQNARTLISNMSSIYTKIGDPNSTNTTDLFGKINTITAAIGSLDVNAIVALLGRPTDTATSNTIFGDINGMQSAIGESATSVTVFKQMEAVEAFTKTAKSNAGAAYAEAQKISIDLGVNGATPSAYAKLKELEGYIKDIQASAMALADNQNAPGQMAQQIVGMIKDVLNEEAAKAGLDQTGLTTEGLTEKQAKDTEKIADKLEEMDAKINAIKEAMKLDDVVVKTWFESEE